MRPSFTAVVCGEPSTAAILQSLGARALAVNEDVLIRTLKAQDSILEANVFVIDAVDGNPLGGDGPVRAMNIVAAIRGLPDYSAMRTGVRWNVVPIVLLSKDDALSTVIRYESRYKRTYAYSYISGMINCYLKIAKHAAEFGRELLADMQSVGWVTVRRMARHHRVRIAIERKQFGARERATALYDLAADEWPRMSAVGQRMYSVIADDEEQNAIENDFNAFFDLIRAPGVSEASCQRFLEEHPHLFQVARHELVSQPQFLRDNGELIIPDFVSRGLSGFHNTTPRLIEIKTPGMRLLTEGKNANRVILSHPTNKAIGQVRDYARWVDKPMNFAERSRMFGVPDEVRYELIAGMASKVDRELLERERGFVHDVTLRTFDELGEEMEHRHTATFPDFGPPKEGVFYVSRSRPTVPKHLRSRAGRRANSEAS